MMSEWTRRKITAATAACGSFFLAVVLTWPLATSLHTHLPLGTEKVASVPMLNAWTVWWNADRARYGFTGYWHAPIFYPARYALAFSEAQPTTLAVAPIVAAAGPAAAYNVYLLASLSLNGILGYRLLRRAGLAIVPALLGGAIVETLPIVQWQLGVLQLTTLWGVVWVIDRLVALRDVPNALNSLLLGIAAAICYAACNYFGLFLSVLLPLACAPLVWGRYRDWRFWFSIAASALVAAGLSLPILWAQFRAKNDYVWHREESLIASLSAQASDYLNPPRPPVIDLFSRRSEERRLWMLGMGPVAPLLAVGGVIAGLAIRGRRRWTLFLLLFAAAAFGLSLGPAAEIRGWWPGRGTLDWSPYKVLMSIHPGLALARSPFRFAFFVQLTLALLAANALDGVWTGVRKLTKDWQPRRHTIGVVLASTVVLAAGIVAAVEVWPAKQKLQAVPPLDAAWIEWLKQNSSPERPIVCLPFPQGSTVADYERTAIFMAEQIGHRRPMVGGYSGFFPPHFLSLKDVLQTFPDDRSLSELRGRNVRFVICAAADWNRRIQRSPSLGLAFHDEESQVDVYRILPESAAESARAFEGFFGP